MDWKIRIEDLLSKANCSGDLVDWTTLKRIREIRDERYMMGYEKALEKGIPKKIKSNMHLCRS